MAKWQNGVMAEWWNGGVVKWHYGQEVKNYGNGGGLQVHPVQFWIYPLQALRRCKGSPFSVCSTRVREKGVATIAFIVSFRYIPTIIILLSTYGRHPRNVDGVRNNGGMVKWRRWWNGGRNGGMVK